MDDAQQDWVTRILADYPTWVDVQASRNDADPFTIALAKVRNLAVVGDEAGGSQQNPKIPFVCKQLGVRFLRVVDFIREIGLRF